VHGALEFKHALIARSADVHTGYLPYSRQTLITQAFKFLGERYGWGHRYNGRDCTGFVCEIYKTVGIILPRNSGDQAASPIGKTIRFEEGAPGADKISALARASLGDLIYMPGHVMMYLGAPDGEPFVIHDVASAGYVNKNGRFSRAALNGVCVTPLLPLRSTAERSFMDTVSAIKSLR
jgi:cell wall-associated NlpC family hydrolase